jgi:hypothetical protein
MQTVESQARIAAHDGTSALANLDKYSYLNRRIVFSLFPGNNITIIANENKMKKPERQFKNCNES